MEPNPKLIVILLGVSLLLVAAILASTLQVGKYNCQQVQNLKRFNLISIKRAEKTLPTLAYYKEHPDELANQRNILKDAEKGNQPQSCASVFNPFPR